MNVMTTEVATKFDRVLDTKICKILVAERYHLLLRNEESQLILAGIGELTQLDTVDFGTNVGREISDLSILQKIRERWISIFAMLCVVERLQWRVSELTVSLVSS